MPELSSYAHALLRLVCLPSACALFACVPPATGDAGPVPRGNCEAGDPDVVIGNMGVTLCEDGKCNFGGASCETDGDCFSPLENGETLPAWVRPQGGIGTRFNLRVDGVPDDDELIESMRILIVLGRTEVACDVAACTGGTCACDLDAGEACLEEDGSARCASVLVDQTYRNFPTECRGDDAVHVEEIPIQFRIGWALEQVDGRTAEVEVHFTAGGEVYESPRYEARMEVGEFITPASFDPLTEG